MFMINPMPNNSEVLLSWHLCKILTAYGGSFHASYNIFSVYKDIWPNFALACPGFCLFSGPWPITGLTLIADLKS